MSFITEKFTIVIPTRERHDVLESSLRTCVTQDYDNLEIIVSDNFSQDETREVVSSFKDKRIRYINTNRRLSMTDNYEFALSYVKGGYVMYLGDDDGLLPNAIVGLNELVNEYNCDAIAWAHAGYAWPDHPEEGVRNVLIFPFRKKYELTCYKSRDKLMSVLNGREHYSHLPVLYNLSFVRHDVILKAIGINGRFFQSRTPDVYSAIAIACVIDRYLYCSRPYTLVGTSRYSIGLSEFSSRDKREIFKTYEDECNIPFHSQLVYAPSLPIIVAEAFLQAKDHLPASSHYTIDIKRVLQTAMDQVRFAPQVYEEVVTAVREIGRMHHLDDNCINSIVSEAKKPRRFPPLRPVLGVNLVKNIVRIDCAQFGVRNVYEASLLLNHLLVLQEQGYYASISNIMRSSIGLLRRELHKRWLIFRRGFGA